MTTTAIAPGDPQSFLRRLLFVDTATCVGTGALLTLGAATLANPLGLPATLLFWAGASLFPIAAFMLGTATRHRIPRPGAWLVIVGNAAWVVASLGVLGLLAPSALGQAFVIAQAAVVAGLAALEVAGVRRLG